MLLTCSNCQNTYFVDDQVYAQQGGAFCEQCQIPLIPVQNGGYEQWNQQEQQWGQQQNAQWGQQDQQWAQPQNAQWEQQNAQWNQQEQQWGQQQNAQWGQQNQQWAQQDQQWGQQQNAQWGQKTPDDAQWGQNPPMDAQWGQQPSGGSQWGSQEQWSQMADKPKETVALMDAIEEPVRHDDNGERTVAIDAAWDDGGEQPPRPNFNQPAKAAPADEWDSWGRAEELPTSASRAVSGNSNASSIIVGKQMDPIANENMTRQIDVRTVQQLYGDKINPFTEFFKSIPIRYLILAGSLIAFAFIGLAVGYYFINKPAENDKIFNDVGDEITADTPKEPRSFDDMAMTMKNLSPSFRPVDGENIHDGSIVAVAPEIGIIYDEDKIADFNEVKSGGEFVSKLNDIASKDPNKLSQPIVFLFDESLNMSVIYRTLYSFGASSRPVRIGGITRNGITTLNILPCQWPDHELTTFGDCPNVSIEMKITKLEMIMHRIDEAEPLSIDPDGTEHMELRDEIIGGKANFNSISDALSRLRSASNSSVILKPDGDVTFGIFMQIVEGLRGSADTPIVRQMYLNKVPLK